MNRIIFTFSAILYTCALAAAAGRVESSDSPVVAVKPVEKSYHPTPAVPDPNTAITGPIDGDTQDIVYLAPKFPVFVRMHIQVDGRGFKALRDDFATSLFKSLDADKNGELDANEMKQIPGAAQLAPVRNDGQAPRPLVTKPVDSAPKDGKVTLDELQKYIREAAGTPVEITSIAQRNRVETNLFERLDADSDGRLNREEMQNAKQGNLWRTDVNDDEFVSTGELAPSNNRLPGVAAQAVSGSITGLTSLLMVVEGDNPSPATVRKLLHLYDKFSRDPKGFFNKDQKLSAEELGLGKEFFGKHDANHNGTLENAELREMLKNPVPQIELLIQLPKKGTAGRAMFKILSANTAGVEDLVTARADREDHVQLMIGGVALDLDMAEPTGNEGDLVSSYEQNFKQFDRDNNGYLDNTESQNAGIPQNAFRNVDRDNDAKIFKEELVDHVRQQVQLASSRTTVNLANTSKTLFELVDDDADGRLSIREIRLIGSRLITWDKDGDGSVSREEVPNNMQMAFGVGQASIFGRQAPVIQRASDRRMMAGASSSAAAPKWFQKMDRNRDGDLSEREFLGDSKIFKVLDADGDGLITAKESRNAK